MYFRTLTALWTAGVVLACLAPAAPASAQACDVTAQVVALDQVIVYNRLGAYAPTGMMFALARDVFPRGTAEADETLAGSCASVSCSAPVADGTGGFTGGVQLRASKRPRPLTLRVNEGDSLCIEFANLLASGPITDAMNEAPGVGVSGIQSEQPATRTAGLHIHGMQLMSAGEGDGSNAGASPSSLVGPGFSTTYRYYAEKEGAYVITSGANLGGEGGAGAIANGLFGVLNVEPAGAEWYRSQLTRAEMDLATPAEAFTDWNGNDIWDQNIPEAFTDWNGNGIQDNGVAEPLTDWNGTGIQDNGIAEPFTDGNGNGVYDLGEVFIDWNGNGVWDASVNEPFTDWDGNGVWDASVNEPFTDLNGNGVWDASVTEPLVDTNDDGIFNAHRTTPGGQPILDYDALYPVGHPYEGSPILKLVEGSEIVHNELNAIITGPGRTGFPGEPANPIYPNRREPFREFTIAFHDEVKVVQAFPEWYRQLQFTLGSVKDGFAVNYGTGGVGSEVIGNRLGVGPMKDCVECKYEEFFLTSWAVGDPAMIVDVPANAGLEACDPALNNCGAVGGKATKAFYPDDPANVWHGYLNDRTKVRNIHVGTEHHIFHLHAHQWGFAADDPGSNYLDAQAIGPGSSFSYEIAFGGGGNRQKTPGDAIFHCHFYPHFAQGMWGLWRVHDVFEHGTIIAADGRPAPGARALPDGEIAAGTPIPAVVPIPGEPMPPMPEVDVAIADGQAVIAGTTIEISEATGNPGYPFFIPGIAGHRPPTPPLDLVNDGGLPRHVITSGTAAATQTATDFDKVLLTATGFQIPEAGTPAELAAMAFHGPQGQTHVSFHDTFLPDGTPVFGTAAYQVNGMPPVPGAPFAEPCRADVWQNSVSIPWSEYVVGNPRYFAASNIELDVDLNKVGWHFGQQRIIVLDGDVADTLAGVRAPEPFVMRANTGDCVDFDHTNLVPNVYQLDDFQVKTPTDVIGQHIHLVKFDVMSADGAANGWNYEDGTLSPDEIVERVHAFEAVGGSWTGDAFGALGPRTTRQRWFLDPGWLGNVFTHDHYGPSTHQQAGLYATLLVEPEGARWSDPVTGAEFGTRAADGGPTSWKADIDCTSCTDPRWAGDAWREFYLEFGDFQLAYRGEDDGGGNPQGTPVNPSDRVEVGLPFVLESNPDTCGAGQCRPEAISAADPGTFVVNYRNEPIAMRLRDPNTNLQAPGLAGDLSFAYQSRTDRADQRLNEAPFLWPYNSTAIQTANQGAYAGDPFTPLLQAYEGDKVIVRMQVGAHEEGHNFSINGIKWLQQWNSGHSGFRNSQMAGISEYFVFEVPALGRIRGDQSFEDYLYQAGSSVDARWNGSWGFLRAYGGPTPDAPLQPLPTNLDGTVPPGNNGDFAGMCPMTAPNRPYAVAAVSAADVLPDLAGRRPGATGYSGGTLVYNSRTTNGGPLHDPTALLYVLESDLEPINANDPLCVQQKGNPRNPKTRIDVMKPGCRVRLRATAPVEPVILRANAGDCLRVELFNKLLQQATDATGARVFTCAGSAALALPVFEDLGLGLCRSDGVTPAVAPVSFDGPFDLDGYNTMPMVVERFNANQVDPSTEVGLHAQLVSYFMSEADGTNVGFNNVQTAPPGGKAEYVWYAGNVLTDPETGFRTPVPVEFGAINLMASDPIKGSNKGLIGGLVVEPQGSTWQCDAGFAGNGRPRLVDCYSGGQQGLPTTRAAATVRVGTTGPAFRDFVTIYQDDVNLRFGSAVSLPGIDELGNFTILSFAAGDPVPTVSAEEEPEDSGGKGLNYRTEPSWFRLGYAPTGDPGFTRTVDYTDVWSNAAVGGDPKTPVFFASAGEEIRFRLLKPGGHNRNQVFTLHGHLWPRHPHNADSTQIDPNNQFTFWHGEQMGHGPSNHMDLIPLHGAGGAFGIAGDYLFRDLTPVHIDNGEWGLLRVQ